jgi:hypothetical protein
MGINKSGQHHFAATIDFPNIPTVSFQPGVEPGVTCSADGNDFPASAHYGAIFDYREFGKGAAASWTRSGGTECEELADVEENQRVGTVADASLLLWPTS